MYEVIARLKVREGELENFTRQAAEIMQATRDLDTRTVRYDWYLSQDGTRCVVKETYADADALVEHAQHIAQARNEMFRSFADDHTVELYAEPSPMLAKALATMPPGAVALTQFSRFQQLEPETQLAEEVPA
jgi:quinol monooxygenase YgiN